MTGLSFERQSNLASQARVIGFAVAVGLMALSVWVAVDRSTNATVWQEFAFVSINGGPLLAGLIAGVLAGTDLRSGAITGGLTGTLVAVVATAALFGFSIVVDPTGNPIDASIQSPIGYLVGAVVLGIFIVPYFAAVAALGGVVGVAASTRFG